MTSLEDQLNQAVRAALTPGPLQSEGLQFLQQLRDNPAEAWQAGLVTFLAGGQSPDGSPWAYKYPGETRLFGLQLVDAMLQLSMSPEQHSSGAQICQTIRDQLWEYILREFVDGSGEMGLGYIRNKLVQTLFLIFLQSYTTTWPDFFTSFAALLRRNSRNAPVLADGSMALNPRTTDLYLRLLHEISTEISDALLRLNKPHARLAKDTEMRDAVRDRDATGIAKETFGIVAEALQGLDKPDTSARTGLTGKTAVECLEMGIRVVEDYVSWIDIGLIVTPTWIPFLYQSLRLPRLNIRLAAGDALICTVTKGMPPANRMQLYNWLGLTEVLHHLQSERRQKQIQGNKDGDDDEFGEKLAKILNGIGVELCKICDDSSAPLDVRSSALQMATQLLPLLLSFFEDDVYSACAAVHPFASAILSRYKKDKKLAPDSHMSPEKHSFISQLLRVVVMKLRYPADDILDWDPPVAIGETEDEDTAAFLDRRKHLKLLMDAIAWVDESTYQEITQTLIMNVLDKMPGGDAQGQISAWQEAELCLFVLYNYGEAIKGSGASGPWSYVVVPAEEIKKSNKNRNHKIHYSQYPLSGLGKMLTQAARCQITQFPHPSLALQWFECVVRYHDFFEMYPDIISDVLPAFLDERGLHHPQPSIRARSSYLFYRFIATQKAAFQNHIPISASQSILTKLQDLVTIQAQVPPELTNNGAASSSDILIKATSTQSPFDSQLYLYEAIGILLSSFSRDEQAQAVSLQQILSPLRSGMLLKLSDPPTQMIDLNNALNAHHSIMAVGALAKGFPDLPIHGTAAPNTSTRQWASLFRSSTDEIILAAKAANGIRIIRDAARSSFHKIVATIGMDALPYVPVFIDCLMDKLTTSELVDFLPFIGQLIHRYKTGFGDLLDSLLIPLVSKIVFFLSQSNTGTDDIISQSELRRAYFNLINSIINTNLHGVLVSERNRGHLESILQTIIQQVAADDALPPDIRLGVGVLHRLVSTWLKPCQSTETSSVPGFERFIYDHVIPLCFSIPAKSKFDWADAESWLILAEISNLIHVVFNIRGDELAQFLTGIFFPSIGCPPAKGQNLIVAFQGTAKDKPSRKPLLDFFDRGNNKA